MNKTYSSQFFDKICEGSRRSALRVLPGVLELTRPASVVDVGCGVGAWASVCHELGVAKVLGIDGDYVDRASLRIPADEFMPFDLTKPLPPIGTFDLVVSLEVAEHLPQESASTFVISLCSLGDVVLFSAAIPFQGGDGHRNEQWPEYWATMFAGQGFECFDVVRPRVWNDADVEYWYAQNALLFVRTSAVPRYPALIGAVPSNTALARVHPQKWMLTKDKKRHAPRNWLRQRARAWWQVLRGQSS